VSETTARPAARLDTAAVGGELLGQLRASLERAAELARVLETSLAEAGPEDAPADERAEDLARRLASAESDVKELASRLVDSEHQGGRLMNLYVATYQLHSTLDPAEVQATIAEIAINLLGAAQFVLLLRRDEGEGLEIALREGAPEDLLGDRLYGGEVYAGGDPMVDATLADGVLRLGPTGESRARAAGPRRRPEAPRAQADPARRGPRPPRPALGARRDRPLRRPAVRHQGPQAPHLREPGQAGAGRMNGSAGRAVIPGSIA
jgi:hypothetical protein